jgi:hypothetical protein
MQDVKPKIYDLDRLCHDIKYLRACVRHSRWLKKRKEKPCHQNRLNHQEK